MSLEARRSVLALSLVLALALSGCNAHPQPDATIGFYGNATATGDQFSMEGTIQIGSGETSRDIYRNVSVKLYDRNGSLIETHPIGDLQADGDVLNVSIESHQIPEYVIVDGQGLWDGKQTVLYHYRIDDPQRDYGIGYAEERCELPVTTACD